MVFVVRLTSLERTPVVINMLKSMTAYGRSQVTASVGRIVVEIQSVNRKFLDLSLSIPRELQCFDPDLRRWVGEKLQRGRVLVVVKAVFGEEGPVKVEPNIAFAKQVSIAWKELQAITGSVAELTAEALLAMDGILTTTIELQDEEVYRSALREAFDGAMMAFNAMQEKEGEALKDDLYNRVQVIRKTLEEVAPRTEGACEKYRARLLDRIRTVKEGAEHDDRIMREVALFAERIDIEEELTRARSHLNQFEELIQGGGVIGKTLDFLLQELLRETNTIGSKASDVDISYRVVEMKSELERIREQVQNVE